jgi:hypothetical protein
MLSAISTNRWRVKEEIEGQETYQEDVVILGLGAQVLEDGLLPELLHVSEVLNETVTDGPSSGVGLLVLHSLVSNVAIKILDSLTNSAIRVVLSGDHSRENVAGLGVTGISHLGVAEGSKSEG